MSDYSALSDKELIRNEPPDSGKIAELISRYMKTVFSCAKRYSGAADYEELVSDGMEGLLSAVRGYNEDKGEFAAFAAVCIENKLRNTAKRSLRRVSLLSDPEALNDIADPAPSPEELVIAMEDSREVMERIETELTPLEKQCIRGAVLGLSYEETARELGVDKKVVDNALSRARAKLRK
ncbi:MAG: sigma-70 family RNA polymerase sigma factor [Lachnospiraceae bacterium]|nr:sigma-70 family RNA polymerase sigma factor [Ruminococcus sp.]MCM1275977.1 sigma-70 family RNA polymerase sigma factor [Lachnospiraceae bacterium]